MVEAEVVYEEEADLLAVVEEGEDTAAEYLVAHEGMVVGCDPRLVVALHELAEVGVGVAFLHEEHLFHGVVGFGEFEAPSARAGGRHPSSLRL